MIATPPGFLNGGFGQKRTFDTVVTASQPQLLSTSVAAFEI